MKTRLLSMVVIALFVLTGCGGDDTTDQTGRSTLLATEGVSCPNPAEITGWNFSLDCDIFDASVNTCEENSLAWFVYRIWEEGLGISEWTVVPMTIDLTNLKRHKVQVTFATEAIDIRIYYKFITINGPGSDEQPPQPSTGFSHGQNRYCTPIIHDWSGGPNKFHANRIDPELLRLTWHAGGCELAFAVLHYGYDEQVENSVSVPYENGTPLTYDLPVSPCEETVYYRLVVDPYCSDNAGITGIESNFTELSCGSGGKYDPKDLPPGPPEP